MEMIRKEKRSSNWCRKAYSLVKKIAYLLRRRVIEQLSRRKRCKAGAKNVIGQKRWDNRIVLQ
jgi:hypothetical protein